MMLATTLFGLLLAHVTDAAYPFDPLQHLAGISPYFEDPLLDPTPPQGCNVTRASMLVRHAAIFAYVMLQSCGPHMRQLLTSNQERLRSL
jgi:acid phosphatase